MKIRSKTKTKTAAPAPGPAKAGPRNPARTAAATSRKKKQAAPDIPSRWGSLPGLASALAAGNAPIATPLQGSVKLDFNGISNLNLAGYLHRIADGLTNNPYYRDSPVEITALMALFNALTGDMELAAALENELKAVRYRIEQTVTQGKDSLRNTARICEAQDSSDEALVSAGWSLKRTPGPAKEMPAPARLVMQPGMNPGQVRARWGAVANRYFYDIQCFNSTGQPGDVPWDAAITRQDTRVQALFSGLPSGTFLTVRVRAVGSKGPGPWCDPLTSRVP